MRTARSLWLANSAMAASLPDGSWVRRDSHNLFCERLELNLSDRIRRWPFVSIPGSWRRASLDEKTYVRHTVLKAK